MGVITEVCGSVGRITARPEKVADMHVVREMLFTSQPLAATHMAAFGLMNCCMPRDPLEATTAELAERVGATSPLVLRIASTSMDPNADFARYVAGIDWGAALVAGAVAVCLAARALRVAPPLLTRLAAHAWTAPPLLAGVVGRARRLGRAPRDPATRWLCGSCMSWNPPGSEACAHGCGSRADCEQPVPVRDDELGRQRGGRGLRR